MQNRCVQNIDVREGECTFLLSWDQWVLDVVENESVLEEHSLWQCLGLDINDFKERKISNLAQEIFLQEKGPEVSLPDSQQVQNRLCEL